MSEPAPSFSRTYKRVDLEQISDEWGWVTDLEFFEDDEDPVELIEEVWVRQSVRTFWHLPTEMYDCAIDRLDASIECDEDAVAWRQMPTGKWIQVCEKHQEQPCQSDS